MSASFSPNGVKMRGGPAGLHFFSRTTGLNILCDEVRVPKNLWASAPRQISIALTNACDLSCPYCFAPKNHASLSIDAVIEWLRDLDANGCLGIGFGGGEPTLYPHFTELCQYAAQKTALAVTFTTHAHRINDALVFALKGAVHFVRVSMDGVGATYEELRGRSFAALRSHVEIIRSLAPFGINFVVNAATLNDLDAAIDFAAEVGAKEFLLLPEQPVGGAGGVQPTTIRALRDWVCAYQGTLPLSVSEAGADGMPTCPIPGETALCAYAHIDADGILKRSSYDRQGVRIGQAGIMGALHLLQAQHEEVPHEDLVRARF